MIDLKGSLEIIQSKRTLAEHLNLVSSKLLQDSYTRLDDIEIYLKNSGLHYAFILGNGLFKTNSEHSKEQFIELFKFNPVRMKIKGTYKSFGGSEPCKYVAFLSNLSNGVKLLCLWD